MINFILGFFAGATVATTVIVWIGRIKFRQLARRMDKQVKDIIINNVD